MAYCVLLLTLIPTVLTFLRLWENHRVRNELRFQQLITQAQETVDEGITRCVDQMYNMRALFSVKENVQLEDWKAYLRSMNIRHAELGFRSIGYIEKVTPAERDHFIQQDRSILGPDFTLRPAGERPIYYPAIYCTDFDPTAQFVPGLDHGSRRERGQMIEQAIDENKPSATDRARFMGPDGMHTNSGIFIYLPVYKKGFSPTNVVQRREAVQGLIFMTVFPQKLLTVLFHDPTDIQQEPEVSIKVFDGDKMDPTRIVYQDEAATPAGRSQFHPTLSRQVTLPVLNRQWTFLFSTTPEFDANSSGHLQWLALFGGLTISVLLFGISWVQAHARLRAEHDARELQRSEAALVDVSRRAGMAEVATSVLHNVGNVLNSVNVSAILALRHVKKSKIKSISRLAEMIHEHRDNLAAFFTTDPRGKDLPGYLTELAEHLEGEQKQLVEEIELTRKNIEHIKDIVTMQQSYAKVSGVVEQVKLADLTEDALRLNADALTRHEVQVIRDYPPQAVEINVEQHKVLQILVNLIRNAKHACDESGRRDKRLTIQIRNGSQRAQIAVIDNGVGIPVENMTRIFNHGFTTRPNGHGFALHSGALAAKELGGTLTAYSDGPGAGARFVLDLPLQPPKTRE